MSMARKLKTGNNGIMNLTDIVRKCKWIPKRQRRCEKEQLSISRGKGTSNSRRMGEELRSQSTWSCRPCKNVGYQSQRTRRRRCERDHQTVALRESLRHHKVFPGTLHGSDGSTKFMEDRENWWFFTKNPDSEPKKGKRGYRSIALTSVMSKWYASRIMPRLEKGKEPKR